MANPFLRQHEHDLRFPTIDWTRLADQELEAIVYPDFRFADWKPPAEAVAEFTKRLHAKAVRREWSRLEREGFGM